tara:strand:+ start:1884 stop:4106 length:2223 start_codon:yes stop_codon:yes gene_type:complete
MEALDNSHALIIGVGGEDMQGTVRDANALFNLLTDKELSGYREQNIQVLTEENATQQKILAAFDKLIADTDEESNVLIFYSGHGGTYKTNDLLSGKDKLPESQNVDCFFLQPYDCNEDNVVETMITAEVVRDKIKQVESKKLIYLLDCCHAAGITHSMSFNKKYKVEETGTRPDGLAQKIDDGMGRAIITSCRENQLSWILGGDINSLFTKCLLEVLRGEHKDYFDEPYIRISEVIKYLFKKIPERKPIQQPYANLQIYDDFILSRIDKEKVKNGTPGPLQQEEQEKDNKKDIITSYRSREDATKAILFVHGFTGESTSSFGNLPQYLIDDPSLQEWDMYPLGFSEAVKPEMGKDIWASVQDIELIANYLKTSLKFKYDRYTQIAIVGYSLGGLVAQRALVELESGLRQKISHLLLFASPSDGVYHDTAAVKAQDRLKQLYNDEPFIKNLRKDWVEAFGPEPPFKIITAAAVADQFISVESCLDPFPEESHAVLEGDHFSILKPQDPGQEVVQVFRNSIKGQDFEKQKGTDVQLTLGKYDTVIETLLPQADSLSNKGLNELIFALEALGRFDEAIKLMKDREATGENADLHGMLAGRYKRQYLKTFVQREGDAAFKHYKMGFDMSQDDPKQLYYHAINLALLSLILHEDEDDMESYAKIALENAQQSRDHLWKFSTLAEAYLYLGKWEEAKEYYKKAAQLADRRQKISIHTNAYQAYTNLMGTENPENEMIKFLKAQFLS